MADESNKDGELTTVADVKVQVEKTQKELDQDREENEFNEHVMEVRKGLEAKSRDELKKLAKRHMDKTACTVYNEETDSYSYRSCCKTGVDKLGMYGVGICLYFQFIRQMGIIFLLCAVITGGNLYLNMKGGMVDDSSAFYAFLGSTTVANLGACESGQCNSDEELRSRCAWKVAEGEPCPAPLTDFSQWIGLADGVGILFIMAWGLWFQKFWIPRTVRANDAANLAPSDFAIDIPVLPRKLAEDHTAYEEKLRQHFLDVLKSLKSPIDDPDAIKEVSAIREYDGAISKFMEKGECLQQQHGNLIKLVELEGKEDPKSKKQHEKHTKSAKTKFGKMKAIDKALAHQASLSDEDRDVVRAFVTFAREEYKEAIMDEYRFSRFFLFRCCQDTKLRFCGSPIKVQQACEPTDLFWENLDYAWWAREIRKGIVILLSISILVVCSLFLVYFQSMKSSASGSNDQISWVVKSNSTDHCLGLCDVDFFGDKACKADGDTSNDWPMVKTFDAVGDYQNRTWSSGSSCTSSWTSPACGVQPSCDNEASRDWIGFEFQEPQQAQCFQLKLQAAHLVGSVQLFGCKSPPPALAERSCWKVEDHCEPMEVSDLNTPTTISGAVFMSDNQPVVQDTSCSMTVSEEVAMERFDSLISGERASNPILSCFCQQQLMEVGPQLMLPPYDTDVKRVCEEWSIEQNLAIGQLLGATAAVLVLNQVLLMVYQALSKWERHETESEVAQSQFWKLFLAQFLNTGVLVLLVNASFKELPAILLPLRTVLNVGTGQYDDFSVSWFVSVGSGLCLTIFMQVFSTTVPPLVMAFFVKPCMACFLARGEVVESRMNRIYQLPEWNLALRMAQTLTVVFVICTYSSGMPGLYIVGFTYSIVAFWMDKWCLLAGSAKPPAYNETIIKNTMNFLPVAAFLHTIIAGWTLGNQDLLPSAWSQLAPLAEMAFGFTIADYEETITAYRNGSDDTKAQLQYEYFGARLLDFGRESCWLLLLIFLVFCVYYIVYWTVSLFLRPFIAPFLFALRDRLNCNGGSAHKGDGTFEELVKECGTHNVVYSYKLAANNKYRSAWLAISHTAQQAKKSESE
eukprot:CAMPEP_0197652752 /NCGR_PEP_ID=MMETSP1338-20131121/34638_1 /TAXON_ID=43686 ORGANISM="Pelagodinium beii, Strain RCC1491" /NCGR_SAMPLE_ID=MMETSP1338 /ASSEMBLY_ACC=CAM_ASM_000754 /LENGTH=1081 /DNA_ID=CAMNT_0043227693 /DNA_START=48 /DNA_END=3293 /DNA_ORIENTATION=-